MFNHEWHATTNVSPIETFPLYGMLYKCWCPLGNAEINTGQDFDLKHRSNKSKMIAKYYKSRIKKKIYLVKALTAVADRPTMRAYVTPPCFVTSYVQPIMQQYKSTTV